MIRLTLFILLCPLLLLQSGCTDEVGSADTLLLNAVFIANQSIDPNQPILAGIATDASIELVFSQPIDRNAISTTVQLLKNEEPVATDYLFLVEDRNIKITPRRLLDFNSKYELVISSRLMSTQGGSFVGQRILFQTRTGALHLNLIEVEGQPVTANNYVHNISVSPKVHCEFSLPIDKVAFQQAFAIDGISTDILAFEFNDTEDAVDITFEQPLTHWSKYDMRLAAGNIGQNEEQFDGHISSFYTKPDPTPKFPILTDEELLTTIQRQTFKYFWDFGHPVSGLARERSTSQDIVTMGGSGFGILAMIVGVERGFITLDEGISRWNTMVDFLLQADRFHGVFPHWMNGATGRVVPFSARDNGGDLVETAFLVQGLLTLRAYLLRERPSATALISNINKIWEEIEWTWYTKGGNDALYWHWSPDQEWAINLPIRGHNETQIVYILASASPTFPISVETYHKGYARSGAMVNGREFYNYVLPLGPQLGGPLFFSHYSYLALDPRHLEDRYANYWIQNTNHSLINYAYCMANPKNYVGYGDQAWGLTASDSHRGYAAHSPNNDLGVISPTAALSAMPYTPDESMTAARYFYETLGDQLWGEYGFYDAYNPTEEWVAGSYLAIDQGPIICMIENHRTGLLWNLFMTIDEVQRGLNKLEFNY